MLIEPAIPIPPATIKEPVAEVVEAVVSPKLTIPEPVEIA